MRSGSESFYLSHAVLCTSFLSVSPAVTFFQFLAFVDSEAMRTGVWCKHTIMFCHTPAC